jgi:hypothetical protein
VAALLEVPMNQTTTPTSDPSKRVYLTTEQAAELVKMAPGTLENWRYQQTKGDYDGPPYTRIGGKVFYEESALYRWLDSQTVGDIPRASGQ